MPLSNKVIKANNVTLVATDLEQSNKDAEKIRKQVYDQGFAAGVALQKEQGLTTVKALSQILREVGDVKKKLLASTEEQMLSLVLAVAEKIIYDEVSTNPQIIRGVLREAVIGVLDREGMKIRLNPQDYHFIMDMKADFLKEFGGVKNVTFEEDGGLQRGGAVLETLAGEVDARLEQRLKEVKEALQRK